MTWESIVPRAANHLGATSDFVHRRILEQVQQDGTIGQPFPAPQLD
jgi:hypothetical protein